MSEQKSYDEIVREQAEGISAEIRKDILWCDALMDSGAEPEAEEFEEEMRMAADWITVFEEGGKWFYEWGLAGPGVGSCNIRISGEIESEHWEPASARLEFWHRNDGKWTEVCHENRRHHYSAAVAVMGCCWDLVEREMEMSA